MNISSKEDVLRLNVLENSIEKVLSYVNKRRKYTVSVSLTMFHKHSITVYCGFLPQQ